MRAKDRDIQGAQHTTAALTPNEREYMREKKRAQNRVVHRFARSHVHRPWRVFFVTARVNDWVALAMSDLNDFPAMRFTRGTPRLSA